MARHLRLRQSSDYQRIREQGTLYRQPACWLTILPNNLPHNRYGFIVAKRVVDKATQRNRIRRHLREVVRQQHPSLKQGFDMAFIVRRDALTQTLTQKKQTLETLLTKAGFLKQES